MSNRLQEGKTLALLHTAVTSNCAKCSEPKKVLTGKVKTALIPEEDFVPLCEAIDGVMAELRECARNRQGLVTEGQLQRMAAECQACDLCVVCAGKHYTYSRDFDKTWPPGQKKCFAFLMKAGRFIKDTPCKLCVAHETGLRKARGDRSRALSAESKLRTQLQKLYAQRQLLFDEHDVTVHVFPE